MTAVGFTRPRERLAEGEEEARGLGLDPLCAPSLDVVHGRPEAYREAEGLLTAGRVSYTVFGSITAVNECRKEFGERLLPLLERTKVVCTGPSTAAHLERELHRPADLIPQIYSSEEIAREIGPACRGKQVLLLRSDAGERTVIELLSAAGAEVHDCAVYSLQPAGVTPELTALIAAVGDGSLGAMLFTSPLSAAEFVLHCREQLGDRADPCMKKVFKVAIGKPTAAALDRQHVPADALPAASTFVSMLETVRQHFSAS